MKYRIKQIEYKNIIYYKIQVKKYWYSKWKEAPLIKQICDLYKFGNNIFSSINDVKWIINILKKYCFKYKIYYIYPVFTYIYEKNNIKINYEKILFTFSKYDYNSIANCSDMYAYESIENVKETIDELYNHQKPVIKYIYE